MENQETQNPADEPKINMFDVVSTNRTIELALLLLSNVNWDLVTQLIENTPENMQNETHYKVLCESEHFYNKVKFALDPALYPGGE